MAYPRPFALIVDHDAERRGRVSLVLREAGYAVWGCAEGGSGLAALARRRFDLAVIAYDGANGAAGTCRAQARDAGIKVLLLVPPGAALAPPENENLRIVAGPLDDRRLGAAILELMTPDASVLGTRVAAELSLIEAQLACLFNRHAEAERRGATRLARDLVHQIGDAMAARHDLRRSRAAPGAP